MSRDLEAAVKAAIEVGVVLKEYFGKAEVVKNKGGGAADVVTQLDMDAELKLEKILKKHNPTIGFKGEEFGHRGNTDKFWLVDPLDGTGLYIRGIPLCTTIIALIEKGQPVLSVVYDFVKEDVYFAEKGKGAFKNKEKIHVSDRSLDEAYVVTESGLRETQYVETYLKFRKKCKVTTVLAAGFVGIYVACGQMDGRAAYGPLGKDWDYAAPNLLIQEAGGIVANIGKTTYDYRNLNFIAANKKVYKALTSGPDALFPING